MRSLVAILSLALCTSAAPSQDAKFIKCNMPAIAGDAQDLKPGPVHFAIGSATVEMVAPSESEWTEVYPCSLLVSESRQFRCRMDSGSISHKFTRRSLTGDCFIESVYAIDIDRRNATAMVRLDRTYEGCRPGRGQPVHLESKGSCQIVDKDPLTVSAF